MSYEMGEHSYGFITSNGDGAIIVGKFCSISNEVQAEFFPDHRVDWISTYPFSAVELLTYTGETWPTAEGLKGHPKHNSNKVVIGNDVWIGQKVIFLADAEVGDGAVIGMHSVVAGKIPPYSVAVGNPARPVKKRFSDAIIEKLLEIKWWDWPKEKIDKFVPLLYSDNVEEFVAAVG